MSKRIELCSQLIGKLGRNPFLPDEARHLLELSVLILGELDDRLTKLERSNDGDGRQAR